MELKYAAILERNDHGDDATKFYIVIDDNLECSKEHNLRLSMQNVMLIDTSLSESKIFEYLDASEVTLTNILRDLNVLKIR